MLPGPGSPRITFPPSTGARAWERSGLLGTQPSVPKTPMPSPSTLASRWVKAVKAFEMVPHHHLVAAARRLGYNLCCLRLTLAAYRLPRSVGIDGAYSRTIIASRGITAGAVSATIDLKVLLYECIVDTMRHWPLASIWLYVDDADI